MLKAIKIALAALVACLSAQSSWAQYAGDISSATAKQPDASSIAQLIVNRISYEVQATDFCSATVASSPLDGSTDATTCLQNAINALCARPHAGGRLYLPAGQYLINGTINVSCAGIAIVGAGIGERYAGKNSGLGGGTQLIAGHRTDSAPVIKAFVCSSSSACPNGFAQGFLVQDLVIENAAGSVSGGRPGPFIEINGFRHALVRNVNMYAPCVGVKFNGGFYMGAENVQSESFEPSANCSAFLITGSVASPFTTTDVVFFQHVLANASTGASCWTIQDRVQTVWWTNTTCETGGSALRSSCPTMASTLYCPGFFTLNDFETEVNSGTSNAIDVVDLVDGMKITNSWFRGFYTTGVAGNLINIRPGRFAVVGLPVTIQSSWFKFAGQDCLDINATTVTIIGNHIYGCNKNNAGSFGVAIRSGRAIITANEFCGGDWLNDVNWLMNGVYLSAGVSYTTTTGNIFNTNTNAGNNRCYVGVANSSGNTTTNIIGLNAGP